MIGGSNASGGGVKVLDERIKQDSEYSQAQYDAVIAELVTEGRL